ncbi:Cellulose synthase-like protein E1 [Abeliophyllum distichum]|uniref:Cellulose synthase-like protein E1 n=1 Tax=Abeliophyllum distichum TaxID=126358 RepID=A0ABD1PVS2_9LAMI
MGRDDYLPLFETRSAKGRLLYWLYAVTVFLGVLSICVYRVRHFPEQELKRWAWIGVFMAELWYALYWLITQSVRYSPVYRYTFKDRLSRRYEEVLPGIDIFVCTADPVLEPPVMVINTVLTVMAYNYPPEKLNVYLSDDGGSEVMFYALLEASQFSKIWLPFCRKFKVEPRSPGIYFSSADEIPVDDVIFAKEWQTVKNLFQEMKERINEIMKLGRIPDELQKQHKGFREWELGASKRDHQTILEILIDGRDSKAMDVEGKRLPTLIYMAREKKPHYQHNFKAGAMNALIRVSSRISNSPIILNVDCDQYSNNSESVRDALCFFMDEEMGDNIAYVQYPQYSNNITKNDVYGNYLRIIVEVELPGADANGGPPYIGSGCFHRRDALSGKKHEKESKIDWKKENEIRVKESASTLEETKILAGCSYEENSQWGKEMGLKYGCPVEDILTGLSVQCRGWRSVFFNPERRGFLGVAPTSLLQSLVQHTRWSEGHIQIFLSKYCPLLYGHGKIPLQLQISYCCYNLWAANCLATLFYVIVPPLCLLKAITLFPQLSSPWVLPYAYVFLAKYSYSLGEFLWSGGTLKGWYNDQRMWLYKRLTSHLYGIYGTILRSLGFSKLSFQITSKVADDDVSLRYEQEIMEFGTVSSMFNILATIALLNLLTFLWIMARLIINPQTTDLDSSAVQIILSGLVMVINRPVYEGMFFRTDKGRMPSSITYQSLILATFACLLALY